jgi:hypothetical protein
MGAQTYYRVTVGRRADGTGISLGAVHDNHETLLQWWPLPRSYGPDEYLRLEVRAVADQISVLADGTPLGAVQDASISNVGGVMIHAKAAGYFRDVVFVPLDKPAAAISIPAAEPWQDLLHDPARIVLSGGAEWIPEGMRFTNYGTARLPLGDHPKRDGAIRMRAPFGGLGGLRPVVRARGNDAGATYQLIAMNANLIVLNRWDSAKKQGMILREFSLREPLKVGQDYELELRVVGQILTAKLNGETLGTATDGTLAEGPFSVGVIDRKGDPVLIKLFEVLNLDAPGGKSATSPAKSNAAEPAKP